MPGPSACYRVLYTKHVRQKRKVFHDGFVTVRGGQCVELLDEEGRHVASARLRASQEIGSDSEGITLFDGFLVNCDEACGLEDIPQAKKIGGSAHAGCTRSRGMADDEGKAAAKVPGINLNENSESVKLVQEIKHENAGMVPKQRSLHRKRLVRSNLTPGNAASRGGIPKLTHQNPTPGGYPTVSTCGHQPTRTDDEILSMLLGGVQFEKRADDVRCTEGEADVTKGLANNTLNERETKDNRDLVCMTEDQMVPLVLDENHSSVQNSSEMDQSKNDCTYSFPKLKRRKFEAPRLNMVPNVQHPNAGKEGDNANEMMVGKCAEKASCTGVDEERNKDIHDFPMDGQLNLVFPQEISRVELERSVVIPTDFNNLDQYAKTWRLAVSEEVNLKLKALARDVYSKMKSFMESAAVCEKIPDPGSKSKAIPVVSMGTKMREAGIAYYQGCNLEVFRKMHRRWKGRKQKTADVDDDEGAERNERMFLKLKTVHKRENYRKDDIWIVCTTEDFRTAVNPDEVFDRLSAPWIAIFKSVWHGPSKEGTLEVELVGNRPDRLGKIQVVHAIHGPQASTEVAVEKCLSSGSSIDAKLAGCIMRFSAGKDLERVSDSREVLEILEKFRLNSDQADAVRYVHSWTSLDAQEATSRPPICLIHGPFGSGKSTLLLALIYTLVNSRGPGNDFQKRKKGNGSMRILVSANTNIAVDRILLELINSGFTDLMRIGSLPKISKRVLKYSIHCNSLGEGKSSGTIAELKKMLKDCTDKHEEVILREELRQAEKGAERERFKRLNSVSVVGVTCCSSCNPILENQKFDVVMLDEASQMTEPMSLMPIISGKARFLIAAGDPCQLPPVICSPAHVGKRKLLVHHGVSKQPQDAESNYPHGLSRPLFVRLLDLGYSPIFLRRQYRCHPDIAEVPNKAFYNGQLINGCTAEDRPALIEDWAPLIAANVKGSASSTRGSISNQAEADAVLKMVKLVQEKSGNISTGVICFFNAQVSLIKEVFTRHQLMQSKAEQESIQVATVDSFQGMEKDIIILSTSITQPGTFCSDMHRLNVALTRAKHHLIIIGSLGALRRTSQVFATIISKSHQLPPNWHI